VRFAKLVLIFVLIIKSYRDMWGFGSLGTLESLPKNKIWVKVGKIKKAVR
jgi:hypothetical protein